MYSKQEPYVEMINADQTVLICRCGKTQQPPFCDHSHSINDPKPYQFKPRKKEMVWICGCNKSKEMPFCDGSHNPRNDMTLWQAIKDIFKTW